MSMNSLGSHYSNASHLSAFSSLDLTDRSEAQSQLPTISAASTEPLLDHSEPTTVIEPVDSSKTSPSHEQYIPIGTALDQPLVRYTARLVTSRFLLTGTPGHLISNNTVRVSIKNLALLVLSGCVRLDPEVLLLRIMITVEPAHIPKPIDSGHTVELTVLKSESETDEELCIIDNHFGQSADATDAPVCNSVDTAMLADATKSRSGSSAAGSDQLDASDKRNDADVVGDDSNETEFAQRIHDVLLFYADSDPMMRGNVVMIGESFVGRVLDGGIEVDRFIERCCAEADIMGIVSLDGLMALIVEVSFLVMPHLKG